jgi:hypothetical protein
MTKHMTGTREEWLAARLELLKAEKELTRRSDELARQREALPLVPVDKAYRFETDEGSASPGRPFERTNAATRHGQHRRCIQEPGRRQDQGDAGGRRSHRLEAHRNRSREENEARIHQLAAKGGMRFVPIVSESKPN